MEILLPGLGSINITSHPRSRLVLRKSEQFREEDMPCHGLCETLLCRGAVPSVIFYAGLV